ncbi:minor tail protein [Mycobacterium phage MOOREtheMARYer]|uniref:Minor tail protein n=1 Tax=Mycobacterium phage MOOREtheMARYer TaxID=1647309 RepID=A0A0F6WET2_9CAUD|nr:minor tail protein [Mycobacterium phage MOOREtheMARYer]AKF14881.1 minor tail protein [Mycobacterium phage MOOREtheMARYer]
MADEYEGPTPEQVAAMNALLASPLEALRERGEFDAERLGFEIPPDQQPAQDLVYLFDQLLDNPVDKHGFSYDLRYLKPLLAWHFARCLPAQFGGDPKVKRREYPNGYVEWVALDAPELPADPMAGMTLEEILDLPPAQRDEAIRRIQGGTHGPVENPDDHIPWKVRTNIVIDEEALK